MNGARETWLVAARELRERGRSRAFIASLVIMIVAVIGAIALPSLIDTGGGTKDVGLTGSVPAALSNAIPTRAARSASRSASTTTTRWPPANKPSVMATSTCWSSTRSNWKGDVSPTSSSKAIVTGAIQVVAVQDRATAAGIRPEDPAALMAPVAVNNVELGRVAGRSPDDETAAFIMTMLLFTSIAIYGVMVLNGVVEEKSSRVVEVLLARTSPRNLLAGKIAGIGLLGLAQIAATALARSSPSPLSTV